ALANLAGPDRLQRGDHARVLDHEGHELRGVAANGKELETRLPLHEVPKRRVRGDADAVAVLLLEHLADLEERLDVAPRADDHDDDVEARLRRDGVGRGYAPRLALPRRRDPLGGRAEGLGEISRVGRLLDGDAQAA